MNFLKLLNSSLNILIPLTAIIFSSQATRANHVQEKGNKLAGEWSILSVNGSPVNNEETYLTFDLKKNRFYGSTGCNTINGGFSSHNKSLSFNNIISTRRYCHSELDITNALKETKSYSISDSGNFYTLSLLNHKGNATITLRKNRLRDLNGSWEINYVLLRGKKIEMTTNAKNKVSVIFDSYTEKLIGNTGYNVIKGTMNIMPDFGIDLCDIEYTTRQKCANPYQENLLRMALEAVSEVFFEEDDSIELSDDKGRIIINMSKTDKRQAIR